MKKLYRTRLNTEIVIKGKYGTETLLCKGKYSDIFYGEKLENTEYSTTEMICIPNNVYSDISFTKYGFKMYLPYDSKNGDIRYKKVYSEDFISFKSHLEYYEISLEDVSIDVLKRNLSAKQFIEIMNTNGLCEVNLFL